MTPMLAAKVPSPWKYAVAFAVLTVGVSWPMLRHARRSPTAERQWLELHVKLRAEGARLALSDEQGTPLFTHLPPGTHDDRARWRRVRVAVAADGDPDRAVAALLADPAVEDALRRPVVALPSEGAVGGREDDGASCPISTPSFESYQGYLGPAPQGIDAPAAWRRGARGQGVWFADVEGAWNSRHEDLPGDRIEHIAGGISDAPAARAHGTAVLGEVVGRDNAKGVVGIAPDVERVFTSSVFGQETADAIDAAAERLRAGDVLLIELHTVGPRGRYVPVEIHGDVFDAIRAATARGVIVVEAAGNGGDDLDHRAYKRAFDRKRRDSGAIMVGAGGPPREGFVDRARLEFSNYGSRVDLQGWGRHVATLDYGDLQTCAGADRHYTSRFAGTSSASPIVAGAAVILEGIARQRGRVLGPAELVALLRRTGTPQTGKVAQAIGPRPDLERAIRELR